MAGGKVAKEKAPRPGPRRSAARRAGGSGAAEGDAAVRAYVAALPAGQRALARRFDAVAAREIPGVRRGLKWGLPFYGAEGKGWFVSCGAIGGALRVTFFQGGSLRPPPPAGEGKRLRGLDLRSAAEFDRAPLASWVRQAARLPGFGS